MCENVSSNIGDIYISAILVRWRFLVSKTDIANKISPISVRSQDSRWAGGSMAIFSTPLIAPSAKIVTKYIQKILK